MEIRYNQQEISGNDYLIINDIGRFEYSQKTQAKEEEWCSCCDVPRRINGVN